MKKIRTLTGRVILAVMLMTVSGCGGGGNEAESVNSAEVSQEFEGTITELYGTSAVVEIDEGFPIRDSGSKVSVSLEEAEATARVGDRVRVTYSGDIMESSPLQLGKQLSIQVSEEQKEAGESWDLRVSKAILSENRGRYSGEECAAEGHLILDKEESGEETKLYTLTMYGEYQFQDGNFVKGAGTGVIPAVLVFQKDEDGAYTLRSCEMPEDGSGYVESIKRMFPEKLREICISPTEEVCAELEKQEKKYASAYLEAMGRTAVIGGYRDWEHPLLTDRGVSVEVSNRLAENRDIAAYPHWIGNIEKLEDGVRYVYQMDFDPEKKQILLTKTEYGSGRVKEVHIFNSETGEPDGNTFPGVTMTLLEVTETGIRVELLNTTELEVEFGEDYDLQEFTGGEWVSVPYRIDDWAFTSIARLMPKDKPVEWEADWETFHGALEPGYYRLVKPVMDFRGTGDYTKYDLFVEFEIEGEEGSREADVLREPPVLKLHDALSSTCEKFEVSSGNYTWYCRAGEEDEMTGTSACGSGPLEEAEGKERLTLPRYNKMEDVICTASWKEMPDSVIVREYNIADLGKGDAETLSNTAYDEIFTVSLKPDRVYEIVAEWKSENSEARGFYGNASYVAVTE